MLGHGPGADPVDGGAVDEEPVPDELPVPVDGVVDALEPVEVEALAGAVVVVDDCVVAAPDARVPMPSPSPAVPAVTPIAKANLRNGACMSHLPCHRWGSSPRHP